MFGQKTREEKVAEGFSLFLRVPGWLENRHAAVKINDETLNHHPGSGTYLEINRNWHSGDIVTIDFPMEVRYLESHPLVEENTGRIAITRGPLVYCLETADNPTVRLSEIEINPARQPEVEFMPDILGGIVQLRILADKRRIDPKWDSTLYYPIDSSGYSAKRDEVEVMAIPYYAWANREPGEMEIWHLSSSKHHYFRTDSGKG
jgi:hypothetical protein